VLTNNHYHQINQTCWLSVNKAYSDYKSNIKPKQTCRHIIGMSPYIHACTKYTYDIVTSMSENTGQYGPALMLFFKWRLTTGWNGV